MDDWKTVFTSYLNSGVYSVGRKPKQTEIKKAANVNELDFTHVDLKKVNGKTDFLKRVADALRFPAYFGMNWDALYDCLTDMSWKPAAGHVIVFANFKSVSENMVADVQIIRNIFNSAIKYWRQKQVPFYIILSE